MDLNQLHQLLSTFFATHPFYCTLLATISFFFVVVLFRGWPWHNNDEQETDDEEDDNDTTDTINPITGTYTITLQDASNTPKVLKVTIKKDK